MIFRFLYNKQLYLIFVPIFLQTLCFMFVGVADTLLLSYVSDNAVGAVGTANSYIGLIFLLFSVVSTGLLAVMTQHVGAKKPGVAFQARQLAIVFNGVAGILISMLLGIFAPQIIKGFGVTEVLQEDAIIYLRIVGAGCFIDALTPVFDSYLVAFGKMRYALIAAICGNLVNLLLDALFIFVFKLGVTGTCIGTLVGKATTIILCLVFGHIKIHGLRYKERVNWKLLVKQIVLIGLPAAMESVVYSIAMASVMTFLNRADATGASANARSYASQITNLAYCAAYALAQANAIINGWAIGEGKKEECYHNSARAAISGIIIGIGVELLLALLCPLYMRAFTNDQELLKTVEILLFIDIALEVGRAANLVYGQALRAAGDSFIPGVMASSLNALLAIGLGYLLIVVCNMGAVGAYIALAADECIRAVVLYIRYRSKKWEAKTLVKDEPSAENV